ncbi:MAG: glycosyltransferase [Nitrospiraceae bacterium]|nr:glycosyltransferase [Nitrospiraceae bacterium]
MPRVSVIIPSYNHEKFVGAAIQSVLDQTFQDFEIVITDDGSTDGTVAEIRKYSDPRIRLLTFPENRGACVAANNCIKESIGEYIAMLSSDDVFLPHKLEKQIAFLDSNPEVSAVFGYARVIDENGDDLADKSHYYNHGFMQPNRSRFELLNYFFYNGNCLCHPSVLIRKRCYEDIGYYDPRYAQLPDFDLWIRLCMRHEIFVLPENLVKFRVRRNDANASGFRTETTQRFFVEYMNILSHWLRIDNVRDFLKIFPQATRYEDKVSDDLIPYFVGLLALETESRHHQLFGLTTIFALFEVAAVREKLKGIGFHYSDLIKVSGEHDIFNFFELRKRDLIIQSKDEEILVRDRQIGLAQEEARRKDEELRLKYNRLMESREKELRELHGRLAQISEQLSVKEGEVSLKDGQLQELQEQVSKDNKQLSELAALLTQKEKVVRELREQKTRDDAQIRELEASAARKNVNFQAAIAESRLNDERSQRRDAHYIFELEQEVARLKAIEESFTWRTIERMLRFYDRKLMPVYSRRSRFVRRLIRRPASSETSKKIENSDCSPLQQENELSHKELVATVARKGSRDVNHILPLPEISEFRHPERLPFFSIVSALYSKEKEVTFFLESLLRQTYLGRFEIIFVDDHSHDNSVKTLEDYMDRAKSSAVYKVIPKVTILRNEKNEGNCTSRNIGIGHAEGDIIVVIDADCMLNKDFLKAHAEAYYYGDCDVVVGSVNLETYGKDPLEVLEYYERDPGRTQADTVLQDNINENSFLNCITRNFSIKKDFVDGDMFDPSFSYSKDKQSGFGWEDVEMGYSLYKKGARIKYVRDAFIVHVSHPTSSDPQAQPLRSLRNFARLFRKHPELLFVARRWALEIYEKIIDWMDSYKHPKNYDAMFLDNMFQRFLPYPFHVKKKVPSLKILTFRWHCPHQYELYKLPYLFTLVRGIAPGFTNEWEYNQRPMRQNAVFRNLDEIDPDDFDIAILHFDENVLSPQNTNGVIGPEWGDNFKWFMKIKIPKIAICHGTPQFYGQYNLPSNGPEVMQVIEQERKKLVDFVGHTLVITNSFQAQREWGFKKSKVIWQGFDPMEFPVTTYNRGILTLGKAMKERPHYRGYHLFQEVFANFPGEFMPESYLVPEPSEAYRKNTNAYARTRFRNYVDNIRQYSIYFNPTLRSPMPRARGEAMMCGLVTVSANNHDVDMFIKNGVNGFYSNDPYELRKYLLFLLRNPDKCRQIGMKGRITAMDIFNHDRYLKAWEETISEILG